MELPKKQLEEFRMFVEMCKQNPKILHQKSLSFFKDWLLSMGAEIPEVPVEPEQAEEPTTSSPPSAPEPMVISESDSEEESAESELEIDNSEVISPDMLDEANQDMGDPNAEVTEEMCDKCDEKRSEAMSALSEQKYEEAIAAFTEAIELNANSAPLFAKRANCYLKLKKPNSTIKDAKRAIELNPDSALGHKLLGMAYKLLGKWEQAYKELAESNKIDYMEDTYEAMKAVEANAKKIMEHEQKKRQKADAKEYNRLKRRHDKAKAAREQQAKEDAASSGPFGAGGMPGGMGGMPGGMGGIGNLLNDPEIAEAMKDPEVMAAFSEILKDPSSMAKHSSNPKLAKVMEKFSTMFGGMGGAGGMPNFGDVDDEPEPTGAPQPTADDLD